MKLYVWVGDGVLHDYTSGHITAIAEDLEGALAAIRAECNYGMDSFPNDKPTAVIDFNDPSIQPRAWVTWGGG
jgi:hypothetical protein